VRGQGTPALELLGIHAFHIDVITVEDPEERYPFPDGLEIKIRSAHASYSCALSKEAGSKSKPFKCEWEGSDLDSTQRPRQGVRRKKKEMINS
jgi:hypothetical protein